MSPILRPNLRALALALAALTTAVAFSGCKLGDNGLQQTSLSSGSSVDDFSRGSGSPALTTANTIRIPGADPAANAAGAAITVFPSSSAFTRPKAVSVVGESDWRAAISMSVMSAPPLNAAMLLSSADNMPDVTKSAMGALNPTGVVIPGQTLHPKAFVAGDLKLPDKTARVNLLNNNYENLSLAVDRLWTKMTGGKPSKQVIVTTGDPRLQRYALPAGPLAANTGSPVFFVNNDRVPLATLRAIAAHKKPAIYVVGPKFAISDQLLGVLRRYGTVRRISGVNPTDNAVHVATFSDPTTGWGWGILDVGHGYEIINSHNEMNVAAATTLASGAAYGPILLNSNAKVVDRELRNYLLDSQPTYVQGAGPQTAVTNRAWLLGDEAQISPGMQATLDKLLSVISPTVATGSDSSSAGTTGVTGVAP
jgi:hypothetical protein